MTPNGNSDRLDRIELLLDQAAKMALAHEERFERVEKQIEDLTTATGLALKAHEERLKAHDERMERVGRHLEVLIEVVDGLIRGKQDKKPGKR